MYQRIFVPIDNSTPSELALKEGIRLAQALSATLVIAHSVDIPTYSRATPQAFDHKDAQRSCFDAGRDIVATAKAQAVAAGLAQVEVALLENHGDPIANVLLTSAHKAQADIIVMGTHGRSGIMHLLLGSVAEGVLRQADLPVLLIRAAE